MIEPSGVTLEDRQTGEPRHDRTFLVQDGERIRVLELRVGRGILRDATGEERNIALWGRAS